MMSDMTNRLKAGLGAVAIAAMAVPLASALATAEDPTQAQAAETSALTAEQVEQGRQLFNDWSCGACHSLADGGGTGHIGPSLDGATNMDRDFIIARVSNGQGAMPGFGGQMTDEEIELLASYIMQAKQ